MSSKRDKIKKRIQEKKRPTFRRQESWRYKRVDTTWRKPRGIEGKMRIRHRGTKGGLPKSPNVGHRTPRDIRGLHPSGYEAVVIHNINEVLELRPRDHAIMIASTIGRRKRIQLEDEVLARGFKLLNKRPEVEEEYFDLETDVDLSLGDEEQLDLDDIDLSDEIDEIEEEDEMDEEEE